MNLTKETCDNCKHRNSEVDCTFPMAKRTGVMKTITRCGMWTKETEKPAQERKEGVRE
jgi:hypothetical protein